MATLTPFIDSLPKEKKEYVAKYAKKTRPSYFSAVLGQTQKGLGETIGGSLSEDRSQFNPNTQISQDLEAVLILASVQDKQQLIKVMEFLVKSKVQSDELELMDEILATRADSFRQISEDLKAGANNGVAAFEEVRSNIFNLLVVAPTEGEALGDEPTAVLIPELSNMFGIINTNLAQVAKPELMAIHDLVVDKLVVSYYSKAWIEQQEELSSWIQVVQVYLTL
jgi:hypothetical protein